LTLLQQHQTARKTGLKKKAGL